MRAQNKYFLYILYFLIVTVLFFYIKFPGKTISKYTEAKINNNSSLKIGIGSTSLNFPPGLIFNDVCIFYKDIKIDCPVKIKVSPSYYSLFRYFDIYCDFLSGIAEIKIEKNMNEMNGYINNLNLSEVNTSLISLLAKESKLSGNLYISFNLKNIKNSPEGTINIKAEKISFLSKLLSDDKIEFNSAESSMSVKNEKVLINKLLFTGNDLNGEVNGTLFLNKDPSKIRLNIKCLLTPGISGIKKIGKKIPLVMLLKSKKKIRFKITGTVIKPIYKLI